MSNSDNTMDLLTKLVVDDRVDGHTFEEIAEKQGISVMEVVRAWKEYTDNRTTMSQEEQWVLHLLRLERLLVLAHARANALASAEDLELFLKIFDRIEALQGLNKARQSEAEAAMVALTKAQTQIILSAMGTLQASFRAQLEEAFDKHKTIKAIRGEVLENFEPVFLNLAQQALTQTEEH